jgi:serine/threonine-protein kinase RsbW
MRFDLRPPAPPPPVLLHLALRAESRAVSDSLRRVMALPFWTPLSADFAASAELVLAEVLNNVAEHAYCGTSGEIEVSLERTASGIAVRVADRGQPMPQSRLPDGPDPDPADLPEGGFGWHLIRSLTSDLSYRRHDGWNLFSFRMHDITGGKQSA